MEWSRCLSNLTKYLHKPKALSSRSSLAWFHDNGGMPELLLCGHIMAKVRRGSTGLSRSVLHPFQRHTLYNTLHKYKHKHKLDQVNSANLLFKLWSMDIVTIDIMIYDSIGFLQGSTGWYLMLLGQYGAILVVTCWYWVSITWYWLVLSCTGLIKGFYACIYWKINGDRPTNQPTNRQDEYRAIC